MGLNKLGRFAQLKQWSHVFQNQSEQSLREYWKAYLPKGRKLILELACGKGEYVISLASMYPDCNYLGVDIKGDRLFIGAKRALDLGLSNVAFIRDFIQNLPKHFQAGDVSEIWLTFPDPYLSSTKFQKRLTHPHFLRIYAELMQNQGLVHLKTDEPRLVEFTHKVLDLYQIPIAKALDYQTEEAKLDADARIYIPTAYELRNISNSQRTYYIAFCPKVSNLQANFSKTQLRQLLC